MAKFKRVYSRWPVPVGSIGVQPLQSRVIDGSLITDSLLRQYGHKLIVIDEASKALEHCGTEIPAAFLRSCRPRANKTDNSAPAVREIYGVSEEVIEAVVEEVVAPVEPVAETVVPEAVVEPVETPAPVVEATETEPAEAKPKKGRKKKTEDPNPFAE